MRYFLFMTLIINQLLWAEGSSEDDNTRVVNEGTASEMPRSYDEFDESENEECHGFRDRAASKVKEKDYQNLMNTLENGIHHDATGYEKQARSVYLQVFTHCPIDDMNYAGLRHFCGMLTSANYDIKLDLAEDDNPEDRALFIKLKAKSAYQAGTIFEADDTIPAIDCLAFRYYWIAAQSGYPLAFTKVINFLKTGHGVIADMAMADLIEKNFNQLIQSHNMDPVNINYDTPLFFEADVAFMMPIQPKILFSEIEGMHKTPAWRKWLRRMATAAWIVGATGWSTYEGYRNINLGVMPFESLLPKTAAHIISACSSGVFYGIWALASAFVSEGNRKDLENIQYKVLNRTEQETADEGNTTPIDPNATVVISTSEGEYKVPASILNNVIYFRYPDGHVRLFQAKSFNKYKDSECYFELDGVTFSLPEPIIWPEELNLRRKTLYGSVYATKDDGVKEELTVLPANLAKLLLNDYAEEQLSDKEDSFTIDTDKFDEILSPLDTNETTHHVSGHSKPPSLTHHNEKQNAAIFQTFRGPSIRRNKKEVKQETPEDVDIQKTQKNTHKTPPSHAFLGHLPDPIKDEKHTIKRRSKWQAVIDAEAQRASNEDMKAVLEDITQGSNLKKRLKKPNKPWFNQAKTLLTDQDPTQPTSSNVSSSIEAPSQFCGLRDSNTTYTDPPLEIEFSDENGMFEISLDNEHTPESNVNNQPENSVNTLMQSVINRLPNPFRRNSQSTNEGDDLSNVV
jgi:hypothetical protein